MSKGCGGMKKPTLALMVCALYLKFLVRFAQGCRRSWYIGSNAKARAHGLEDPTLKLVLMA